MVHIIFRTRLRSNIDGARLEAIAVRMAELAEAMPGFVSYKDFAAPDGENVTLVEFDTLEHLAAWRGHPEHLAAQQAGRDEFFAEYRVSVCTLLREQRFP